jgi:hypothetical protein
MYKKIDHIVESNKKLLYQFQDKVRINIILNSIMKQLNDVEDTLFDMKTKRGINDAIGKQLDVIGAQKSVSRNSLDDEIYRQEIKNRIALDNSKGFCLDILSAAKVILGGGKFEYKESYPARCEVFVSGKESSLYQFNYIKKAVGLCVSLGLRFCKNDKPFGYNKINYSGYGSIYNNNSSKGGGYASILGDDG